jgi:hypothetical protein
MAIELHVLMQVVDSEPENPMNQGILFKSMRVTCSVIETEASIKDAFTMTRARVDTIATEVATDLQEQLRIAEESADG